MSNTPPPRNLAFRIKEAIVIAMLLLGAGLLGHLTVHSAPPENFNDQMVKWLMDPSNATMLGTVVPAGMEGARDTRHQSILTDPAWPRTGYTGKDATILVYVSDYACPHCRVMEPIIEELIASHQKLQVINMDVAVLGENSKLAARYAAAVHLHHSAKYAAWRTAVVKRRGVPTAQLLAEASTEVGLDAEQVAKEAASPDVTEFSEKVNQAARDAGLRATPHIFVNGHGFTGEVSKEILENFLP